MPAFYQITFLHEARVEEFGGSRGNYYEMNDGSHIDVETVPVWCNRCRAITDGERVEPLAEIDKQLADLHDPNSKLFRFLQVL